MSRSLIQEKWGGRSSSIVFVVKGNKQDSVDAGTITNRFHGPGSAPDLSDAPLDGMGGSQCRV